MYIKILNSWKRIATISPANVDFNKNMLYEYESRFGIDVTILIVFHCVTSASDVCNVRRQTSWKIKRIWVHLKQFIPGKVQIHCWLMTQIFTNVLLCLMKTEIDFVFQCTTHISRKGKNKWKGFYSHSWLMVNYIESTSSE